ncbi:unnamed protein product [Rotaria sp. Silwood2]|nr:unnamed protein product [Rotaria sp. Silwood2]
MAEKDAFSNETENKHERFLDVGQEPRRMLQPIEGYQKLSLVPLEDAVEPIVFCCPDIRRRVFIAMSNCENPTDGLSQDESASIYLYTMEWEPREECLYYVLNATLRTENRQKLKPWFLYFKLVLTALQKLPPQKATIWRGVTLDLSHEYEVGKRYVWWAFSSCTESIAVLESDLFLGKQGTRTLFSIECNDGRMIQSHSYINVEDEVLLLPATQFQVKSKLNPAPSLHIIHLKQVEPPFPLIESPSNTQNVQLTTNKEVTPYRNEKLEKLIAECPMHSVIDLNQQELTDLDIPILIERSIIEKQCRSLYIHKNKITSEGARHIGKVLESNTSLTILSMYTNRVANQGVRWIAKALHTNTTLTTLSLGNNEITEEGAKYLAAALYLNATLQYDQIA